MPLWVWFMLILLNVPAVSNIPDHVVAWDDYIILAEGSVYIPFGSYAWTVDKTLFVGNELDLPVELVITNLTDVWDVQFIVGKDRHGNYQKEAIDISGGVGVYVTEKRWSYIASLRVQDAIYDFILRYKNVKIKGGGQRSPTFLKPVEWFVAGGISFLSHID